MAITWSPPEHDTCGQAEVRIVQTSPTRFAPRWAILCIAALYVVLAFAAAATRAPWCDEGWFAGPAYQLAFHGHMGTPSLEPSGHFLNAYLRGIEQRTYIVPPVYLVSMAVWFKAFGFGLVRMRLFSIAWGLLLLFVTASLTFRWSRSQTAALLAMSLNCVSILYLWNSTDGRMDTMCAALCFAAVWTYLELRATSLSRAVLASQTLLALAFYAHLNAVMGEIWLLILFWREDRRRFRWSLAGLAALPFVAGLLGWLPYILQAPGDFRIQFLANAAGRNAERFSKLLHPGELIGTELLTRYLGMVHPNSLWLYSMPAWSVVLPVVLLGTLLLCWTSPPFRRERGGRTLALLTSVQFAAMMLLVGMKAQYYLIFIVPFYHMVLALWSARLMRQNAFGKAASGLVLAAYVLLNVVLLGQQFRNNPYQTEYQAMLQQIRPLVNARRPVIAQAALGFDLPYSAIRDDARFGLFTGFRPDAIVIDRQYRNMFDHYVYEEPAVFLYSIRLLREHYRLSYSNSGYEVYLRVR